MKRGQTVRTDSVCKGRLKTSAAGFAKTSAASFAKTSIASFAKTSAAGFAKKFQTALLTRQTAAFF
ncbi:hypothetical protein [Neisseria sp. CCUG12390]|uniref:hypothetical protein n=1 Tax=Neisseria sp. CCUG12390 TaxID=3392035 RepID=UPI003A0FFAC6